jgi:beta-glucosidase
MTLYGKVMLALSAIGFSLAGAADFRDFTAPVDARVDNLVSQLTTLEKLSMRTRDNQVITRLGISAYMWWDEMEMGWTTIWPSGLGKSCSWDRDLVYKIGVVMGDEARADHPLGKTYYSPCDVNIAMDPRAGRNDETWGEDPYLCGDLAVLLTCGAQDDRKLKMRGGTDYYIKSGCIAKHFVGNNHEHDRFNDTSVMDERDFREYFMPPFEDLVKKADVSGFMTGLNKISVIGDPRQQGLWNYENPVLLDSILRSEWGFKGYVTTDCAGNHDGPKTVTAGVDALCPTTAECIQRGTGEIDSTRMPMQYVTRAIKRMLRIRFRSGEFDPDSVCPYRKIPTSVQNTAASQELARRAAREAIVLLKNTNSMLPLSKTAIKKIALVGVVSEHPVNAAGEDRYFGGYCRNPVWSTVVNLKTALGNLATANGMTLTYAKGLTCVNSASFSFSATEVTDITNADVVICAVGSKSGGGLDVYQPCQGDHRFPKEGEDMIDINLPGPQEAMLSQVYKYNHKTVVVLQDLAVRDVRCAFDTCPAVISSLGAGQAMGQGMVDVLFGDFNPSAKTTQTWVRGIENYPQLHRPMQPGETSWPIEPALKRDYSIRQLKRTYLYYTGPVNYPFGYGLSYTTFAFSNISHVMHGGDTVALITFSIQNSGTRDGAEVAQLYIHSLNTTPVLPIKALRNFSRTDIVHGTTTTITLAVTLRDLAYWSTAGKAFVADAGKYEIQIGNSSQDIRLRDTITIPFTSIIGPRPQGQEIKSQSGNAMGKMNIQRIFVDSRTVHFSGNADERYVVYACNGKRVAQRKGSEMNRYLGHAPKGVYVVIGKKQ